jgi:hypothetical protein
MNTMSTDMRELPMAPADCTLDEGSLAKQLDRYRRLGRVATSIQPRELALEVTFPADVDIELVHETIAIERGCCSFFTLDYETSERRLSIAIGDPARGEALRALLSALSDGASQAAGR